MRHGRSEAGRRPIGGSITASVEFRRDDVGLAQMFKAVVHELYFLRGLFPGELFLGEPRVSRQARGGIRRLVAFIGPERAGRKVSTSLMAMHLASRLDDAAQVHGGQPKPEVIVRPVGQGRLPVANLREARQNRLAIHPESKSAVELYGM